MNRLQLKALLLSVITEIKFGMPLARNAVQCKKQFKDLVGLPKNVSNVELLKVMKRVYIENKLGDDFTKTLEKFKVSHLV